MAFGAYIRQKREAKGIQMNDFARQLDISPAYWSRIERDIEKPPKDELIRKAVDFHANLTPVFHSILTPPVAV